MVTLEQLPLELWQRILSFLDEEWEWRCLPIPPEEINRNIPIKNLSLVSRALRMRTISTLFTYVNKKLHFCERKIFKAQEMAFSKFVDFIQRNGLQGKKVRLILQVIVDESKKGGIDGRSANWRSEKKDWHLFEKTASLFNILNVEMFVLQLYHKWKKQITPVNILSLTQKISGASYHQSQSDILLLQNPWTSMELWSLPWNQHSEIHYSMTDFSRRTPSLLKPVEAPLKYPYLEMRLPTSTYSFELPGMLNSLIMFSYRPLKDARRGGESDREIDLAPIRTILASNCPNLQHLRIKIFPSIFQELGIIEYYARFIRILIAKPNLDTPKTFAALDIPGLHESRGGSAWYEERLGHELSGWEHIGLGEYRSVVSRYPKKPE